MISIVGLLLIALIAWLWADSLQAKKIAIEVSRRACEQRQLQLLDDTACLKSFALKRSQYGHMSIWRTYEFEYYQGNNIRLSSTITLAGKLVVHLGLNYSNNIIPFPKLNSSHL